jgi:hypothetical protein
MEHTLLTIWGFLAYMAFWSLTPIKFWCFKSISLDKCYVGNICTNIHSFKAGRAGWNRAGFKKIGEGKNPDDLVKNPAIFVQIFIVLKLAGQAVTGPGLKK